MEDYKMEENLKVKDGAKILYHLYADYFNRLMFKEIYVSLELTEEQEQRFQSYDFLTDEEIWAYANRIIDLTEKELFSQREEEFSRIDFLQKVVEPLVKVFTPNSKKNTVKTFVLDNCLLKGGIRVPLHWMCEEKSITVREANRIVDNVIGFLGK